MTSYLINAFYDLFAHALKKPGYACVHTSLPNVPAINRIRVIWQLGRDTSHVPAGLKYPRGG